ncbi:MAG: large subunit ribosomal protein L25 [Myxococcota bacterium]|jgi:large subunit ribosomal protein L25
MARQTLNVNPRTDTGKGAARRLRAAGKLPGVVYAKGKDPVAITLDPKAVVAVLHGAYGRNTTLDLMVDGEKSGRLAIIKDYQVHPWKRIIEHVDLWEVDKDQKLILTVPFVRKGRTESERLGSKVRLTRDDIKVSCKAADVPAAVEFDLDGMPNGDHNITVSNVPMPSGVTAVFKHDYSLVQIKVPRVPKADEEEVAAAAS